MSTTNDGRGAPVGDRPDHEVIVIGAGFGGIGAGEELS